MLGRKTIDFILFGLSFKYESLYLKLFSLMCVCIMNDDSEVMKSHPKGDDDIKSSID